MPSKPKYKSSTASIRQYNSRSSGGRRLWRRSKSGTETMFSTLRLLAAARSAPWFQVSFRSVQSQRVLGKERKCAVACHSLFSFVEFCFFDFFFLLLFFRRREIPHPRRREDEEEGEPISSPGEKKHRKERRKKIHSIVINTKHSLLTYEVKRTKMALTLTASTVVASVKPTVSSNRR